MEDIEAPTISTNCASSGSALELAVVVPTLNEAKNIPSLVEGIKAALIEHTFEIVVVDDNSSDGTADRVRELAQSDFRVRCIQRIGRRGLSSAVIEGVLATAAPVVAVLDGDMQHDEKMLPLMLDCLRTKNLEIVVASRYLEPDGTKFWSGGRLLASKFATALARRVTKITLSDPMSGFFMIRTEMLRHLVPKLSCVGFKILLDILVSAPKPLRYCEIPYQFRSRMLGESKMDAKVLLEFLELLVDKLFGRIVPAKFVIFALVGGVGVAVHLTVLGLLFKGLRFDFQTSYVAATLTAMTSNFAMNNTLTYHDRRLTRWGWVRGWFSFAIASSIGLISNIGIATYLFSTKVEWFISAFAGILVGVVWNYAATSVLTWRPR